MSLRALDQLGGASGADLVGASQHPVQLHDRDQAELRKPGSFSVSASITVDAIDD